MKSLILLLALLLSLRAAANAQPPIYKNLVLEGGGVRGFAYAGAFETDPDKILVQFKAADKGLQKAHYLMWMKYLRKLFLYWNCGLSICAGCFSW